MLSEQTPSDQSRLVSELADDQDFANLIELFVSELPDRLAAIEHAFQKSDHDEVARLTHQLKAAGPGYGFPSIGEAAASVEDWYRSRGLFAEEELADVREKIDALLDLCSRATHH